MVLVVGGCSVVVVVGACVVVLVVEGASVDVVVGWISSGSSCTTGICTWHS